MAEDEALARRAPPRPRGRAGRRRAGAVSERRSTSTPRSAPRSRLIRRSCAPRSGSTPPTTLVPPPNGTTATPSAAQASSTRRDRVGVGGQEDRVGGRVEPAARAAAPGRRSRSRSRGGPGPRLESKTASSPTASTRRGAAAARPRAARVCSIGVGRRGAGSSSPTRSRSAASASASSSARPPGRPTPTTSSRCRGAGSSLPGQRPLDARRAPASRISPWPRRIIGEPSREIPRSVCAEVERRPRSRRPRRRSAISTCEAAQVALERRPLELLLPDVALALGRADAAVVGAHAAPLGGLAAPSSTGCAGRRLRVDVLDPRRARPPARQAVGVGDQRPDLGAGRGDRAPAGDPRHPRRLSRPARRRRSRTSSRCLRWLTVAARLSRLSSASLRRSGLRERSDGPEQRFEQVRLAVGRGAEDAQVARPDADAGQFVGGADDLAVGLVVDGPALAFLRLDDAEVLELGDQLLARAGLLDHLVEASGRRSRC